MRYGPPSSQPSCLERLMTLIVYCFIFNIILRLTVSILQVLPQLFNNIVNYPLRWLFMLCGFILLTIVFANANQIWASSVSWLRTLQNNTQHYSQISIEHIALWLPEKYQADFLERHQHWQHSDSWLVVQLKTVMYLVQLCWALLVIRLRR